jgi:hypothetical protein
VPADDVFFSFRTTIAAKAELGALAVGGEIVDARGYGQRDGSSVRTGEINALEPVQAYVAYRASDVFRQGRNRDGHGRDAGRSMWVRAGSSVAPTFPTLFRPISAASSNGAARAKTGSSHSGQGPSRRFPTMWPGIEDNAVELDRAGGNLTFFGVSAMLAKAFGNVSAEAYGYRLAEDDRTTRLTRNRHLVTAGMRLRRGPAKGQVRFRRRRRMAMGHRPCDHRRQ